MFHFFQSMLRKHHKLVYPFQGSNFQLMYGIPLITVQFDSIYPLMPLNGYRLGKYFLNPMLMNISYHFSLQTSVINYFSLLSCKTQKELHVWLLTDKIY